VRKILFFQERNMGAALVGLGTLLIVVGWVWIIVMAFQSGDVLWGVLSIFCGILAIVWAAMHMDRARTPLLLMVGGIIVNAIGGALGGVSMPQS
jgi:hypothetical protein